MFKQVFILGALSIGLVSCMLGPNFRSPAAPHTQSYTGAALRTLGSHGKVQYLNAGQDVPAEWWTLFHSPALNQLIQKGLNHSPTLEAAQASLRQAQENRNVEVGMALFPALTANLSGSRQRSFVTTGSNTNNQTALPLYNLFNASVNVSYALDIFGGARRQLESLQAQVDYQRFQVEATYLTLAANIVTTAITEAALREQTQTMRTLVHLQENELNLVKKQLTLGAESQAAVLTQETLVAQTRASLAALEKNLAQIRNALAVLVGMLPSEAELPHVSLSDLHLPTHLPLSLPSALLRQRPDVRASEAMLHSASAQIGVNTAALFPLLTLNGNYGSTTTLSNALFKANSTVWGLGAQAAQPIFKGGALLAKRRGAIAAYDQAAAQYRQTVLQAFQSVADVLHSLEFDSQTLHAQLAAEAAAKSTWKLTAKQYELGAVSYLSVLDTQRQYQQTSLNRIQAQALRYADTAALFQALGGGWWNRDRENKL